MLEAYICDYIRTPIGRFGGALASVRADDLGAVPLKALMARHASLDAFAVRSQAKAAAAQASGRLAKEIAPVMIPQRKGAPIAVC
jgi:acetyl-CoA acyltransferase